MGRFVIQQYTFRFSDYPIVQKIKNLIPFLFSDLLLDSNAVSIVT
jgi:hypothetical protein